MALLRPVHGFASTRTGKTFHGFFAGSVEGADGAGGFGGGGAAGLAAGGC